MEVGEYFDYWCPECGNYVLLEKDKGKGNNLEGKCALCGETFYIAYEDFKKYEKENEGGK